MGAEGVGDDVGKAAATRTSSGVPDMAMSDSAPTTRSNDLSFCRPEPRGCPADRHLSAVPPWVVTCLLASGAPSTLERFRRLITAGEPDAQYNSCHWSPTPAATR